MAVEVRIGDTRLLLEEDQEAEVGLGAGSAVFAMGSQLRERVVVVQIVKNRVDWVPRHMLNGGFVDKLAFWQRAGRDGS